MSGAEDILKIAAAEVGYCESPPGSNRTKYGRWYGLDGQPWCMMFVQWVFEKAGASALLPVRTASCGALMRSAQGAGQWVQTGFRPGDVVIYDFPGTGAQTDHVGIVEQVREDGIVAIEGNTADKNDANGGAVMRRLRQKSVILGAVRPRYQKKEQRMDNTPSAYAEAAVRWAREQGILFGDERGDWKLHEGVTREQALTFLYRFAKGLGTKTV